ncbi:hypothetical protein [Salinithrix halophila]
MMRSRIGAEAEGTSSGDQLTDVRVRSANQRASFAHSGSFFSR